MADGRKRHNWGPIEDEYITGDASMRKLAAKHGISDSTLLKRAKKYKWADKRARHRTNKATAVKRADTKDAVELVLAGKELARVNALATIKEISGKLGLKGKDGKKLTSSTALSPSELIALARANGIALENLCKAAGVPLYDVDTSRDVELPEDPLVDAGQGVTSAKEKDADGPGK